MILICFSNLHYMSPTEPSFHFTRKRDCDSNPLNLSNGGAIAPVPRDTHCPPFVFGQLLSPICCSETRVTLAEERHELCTYHPALLSVFVVKTLLPISCILLKSTPVQNPSGDEF